MDRPTVLVTTEQLHFVEPALSPSYEVIKAWENPSRERLARARAVVCLGNHPLPDLDALPSLGLVACFTTGYESLDVPALRARGLAVSHAPAATAEPVGEFALALILAASRNLVSGHESVLSGRWKAGPVKLGRSLTGQRLGVVGLGGIGLALATKATALGMSVAWWGPRDKPETGYPYVDSLERLAAESDVLAVCARSDESNRHLVSAAVIDALGPEGLLVNVARGQLVDEDALRRALVEGRLGGAALDVFAEEPTPPERWRDVPNLLATPHIAGATRENAARMTAMMVENLDRFFAGRELATPVPH